MPNTKYRCTPDHREDMAAYMTYIQGEDNGVEHSRLKRNLLRCLREDISPRQRTVLLLYFAHRMSQPEIAAALGVNKSTVSRTIRRGERRLLQCLRYGAQRYLLDMPE